LFLLQNLCSVSLCYSFCR